VAVCIGWNLRLAQYAVRGALPKNTANAADYVREFPVGDPHRVILGSLGLRSMGQRIVGCRTADVVATLRRAAAAALTERVTLPLQ
jgi:hypothetical protein